MIRIAISPIKPHLLPVALLLTLTFAAYGDLFHHDFLISWDDSLYVTGNEAVRGFTADHLRAAFTRFYVGNYAPLQLLSYMLDYTLWGMRAGGFLLTNVVLHAGSGLLFYLLVFRLHGRRLWAFIASFVFLLHPVQVESVAWVSQRKNVLALSLFLLSLLLYRGYRQKGRGRGRAAYFGSLLAFSLSLLAKAVSVILPAVLVCLDACFLQRGEWRRRLPDKLPYLLAAAAVGILTYVSQDPEIGGGRSAYWGGSLATTLLTMLPVFVRYLVMILWPARLSPVYDQPFKDAVDGQVLFAALILVLVVGAGFLLCRGNRRLAFWLLFYAIALLPVSQVVPLVTLMNDRYLYFPLLGFAAFFAGVVTLLADSLPARWGRGVVAGALLLLLPLPLLAHRQAAVWENATTLWRHAVDVQPGASLAWLGYGHALMTDGYPREALAALLRSYELYPEDEDTLLNLGLLYKRLQAPLAGRPYLLQLTRANPRHFGGLVTLGENYRMTRDYGAAEGAFRAALALRPGDATVLGHLATLYGSPAPR
jgi:tetratricopeptide (TPR) repeat protein